MAKTGRVGIAHHLMVLKTIRDLKYEWLYRGVNDAAPVLVGDAHPTTFAYAVGGQELKCVVNDVGDIFNWPQRVVIVLDTTCGVCTYDFIGPASF